MLQGAVKHPHLLSGGAGALSRIWNYLGLAYKRNGDLDKAEAAYTCALQQPTLQRPSAERDHVISNMMSLYQDMQLSKAMNSAGHSKLVLLAIELFRRQLELTKTSLNLPTLMTPDNAYEVGRAVLRQIQIKSTGSSLATLCVPRLKRQWQFNPLRCEVLEVEWVPMPWENIPAGKELVVMNNPTDDEWASMQRSMRSASGVDTSGSDAEARASDQIVAKKQLKSTLCSMSSANRMCARCGILLDRRDSNAPNPMAAPTTFIKAHKCARCEKEYYCSRECQKEHWKIHKKVCTPCKD